LEYEAKITVNQQKGKIFIFYSFSLQFFKKEFSELPDD